MVKSGLSEDASVSQYRLATHLGMALVIFSLLIWTALDIRDGRSPLPRGHAAATIGIVGLTILAGALVAGMDAGLLYNEYPLMGSGLIPIEYGEQGLFDPFENPASAQFHHRWIAVLAVLAVLGLAFNAKKTDIGNGPAYFAMVAVAVQFLLGITTLLHGVPVALGGLHQAGAVILLGSVIWLSHGLARTR
jgi:cytochrome c oxidase assembly protein subunit 15